MERCGSETDACRPLAVFLAVADPQHDLGVAQDGSPHGSYAGRSACRGLGKIDADARGDEVRKDCVVGANIEQTLFDRRPLWSDDGNEDYGTRAASPAVQC